MASQPNALNIHHITTSGSSPLTSPYEAGVTVSQSSLNAMLS
ncbi:hypothetical protein HD593_003268 [Nonomuraea rubra]|uniref:Uncharacterized protein n=1 Tax=Nonomuraea rubra TaxID=46180 RepID=A0A7X0TYI7_9ACTN|nr:hypothetical protein [Nonomuraea rubra]